MENLCKSTKRGKLWKIAKKAKVKEKVTESLGKGQGLRKS
jgi:hypothetical protein